MSSDHQDLARKILLYSRRCITQCVPIMLAPIYALREEVSPIPEPLATDGVHLWYNPERVIQDFKKDHTALAQLLHVTLHCLLGHLALRPSQPDKEIFDIAADWKVGQFIQAMDPKLFHLRHSFYSFNNQSLYTMLHTLQDKEQRSSFLQETQYNRIRLDNHNLWNPEKRAGQRGDRNSTSRQNSGIGEVSEYFGEDQEAASPNWQEMLQDMSHQTQGSGWGTLSGLLRQELEPAEENQISYANFLQRFAAPRERLLLDPDSFDPRWYHLGLEQYGDIPLLEPSELSEPPAPDDLVIALDTSGSCSGDICRRFLRETMSLLRDISAGAASFRVLLLQCDTEIQQELLLESGEQIDTFLEDFTPQGFGGTDFCPVFKRVAQRQADGILPRVKGLLYLSDGFGSFPNTPPDYPVTFLLLQEETPGFSSFHQFTPVPDWCSVLYLNANDFTLKEASV